MDRKIKDTMRAMLKIALIFCGVGGASGLLSFATLIVGVSMTGRSIAAGERAVIWIGAIQALIWIGSSVANTGLAAFAEAPFWAKALSIVLYLLLAAGAFFSAGLFSMVLLNR